MATDWADLSLSQTVSSASPTAGSTITYTLTATNAANSPNTATGVQVTGQLPVGATYVSHSGAGTYNPVTGLWTVGSLTAGQSRTLTITATVNASAGASVTSSAEITASSHRDLDSTPGNGIIGEDDYASATFTVSGSRTAGIAPMLICPRNTVLFDWDAITWAAASTNNSYALAGLGTVSFAITNQGVWLNLLGGNNPVRTTEVTGGLSPVQNSLAQTVNFANSSQTATTTITLPMAVAGAQFRMFDVDYGAGQFADRVRVYGSLAGVQVIPVLTNGVSNYVIGNQAFGDSASDNNSANGNLVVTFQSAVDTIVIEYGSHSLAPADPGQQGVTLHDIAFCAPHTSITATKTSTVLSNPVQGATNPLAIPGAVVQYCLLVTNSGSAPATNVVANDPLPATLAYIAGSLQSGTTCANATTAEDDNATGADETDPVGASFSSNQVRATAATLAAGSSFAVRFRATVN